MSKLFKVIIAGGREYSDYDTVEEVCNNRISNKSNLRVVSGGASGADALGERYAKENNYKLMIFKANWRKHGRSAGPIRNKAMALYADALIAFWDGKSRGTKHMIDTAKASGLLVKVHIYR